MHPSPTFRVNATDAEPIRVAGTQVTPRSRVVSLDLGPAAFVWHVPTSVLVERAGKNAERLPILDVTFIARLALAALAILAFVIRRNEL